MEYFSSSLPIVLAISLNKLTLEIGLELIFLLLLLLNSALISGSEVAYFSFAPQDIKNLSEKQSKIDNLILKLLNKPERLLATILITNNFVNIGIILLTTFITSELINFGETAWLKFLFEIVFVTFLILLFGEIIPKVYANQNNKGFAKITAYPLLYLEKIFYPLSSVLIKSTSIVNKRFTKKQKLSIEDISTAIDITENSLALNKTILKGAVEFGNVDVKEIMTPRVDVVAVSISDNFNEIKQIIIESNYSRIPVYEESLDNIKGILFNKDLIEYIDKDADFAWKELIKKPFFVPEAKKIGDLLQEFRKNKTHLAIVSDEYGGISGVITLEDILEEIVGEIQDEFDEQENNYIVIDKNNFIFDAKISLKEITKVINKEKDFFHNDKGDSETIAGFILEILGDFPVNKQVINYNDIVIRIESINKRRIVKIKITTEPEISG